MGVAATQDSTSEWRKLGAQDSMHKNAAVVALANKLARIVWVVLRRGAAFDAAAVSSAAA